MKTKKTPMRRCIGCMESKPKNTLIRVACYEGQVNADPSGRAKGRGVYLCRNNDCMDKALKRKALQRNFDVKLEEEQIEEIFQELRKYAE